MSNIKITLKDGTVKDFPHEGRPGGSYTKRLRYEGAFVIVTDEWDKQTAFAAQDVKEIEETPHRMSW